MLAGATKRLIMPRVAKTSLAQAEAAGGAVSVEWVTSARPDAHSALEEIYKLR